jgi:carbonic anhydrase/acetyltransferase-like protein (isoleucine patch superfamily)
MPEFALGDKRPRIHPDAFVAPTATIIGDVEIGAGSSIWFGAVLRGDESSIRIGAGSNVQDNAVVHCSHELPTIVGDSVTVGHSALLEGCVIEDGALVGMGAIALQRSRLGEGSILAAGSLLKEGQEIPGGKLAAGVPAAVKKDVDGASRWRGRPARVYRELASTYRDSLAQRS